MTDVRFYHLTRKRLEEALPEILAKAQERQMRAVVKLGSQERASAISTALWTFDPGSFLPHGHVRDGFEAEQPVWLTTEDENPNRATMLVLADGAISARVGDFTMCCEFLDGNDEASVSAARMRWKLYKEQGHEVSYFQQNEAGKWEKKA